jgi:hypothetical protein
LRHRHVCELPHHTQHKPRQEGAERALFLFHEIKRHFQHNLLLDLPIQLDERVRLEKQLVLFFDLPDRIRTVFQDHCHLVLGQHYQNWIEHYLCSNNNKSLHAHRQGVLFSLAENKRD